MGCLVLTYKLLTLVARCLLGEEERGSAAAYRARWCLLLNSSRLPFRRLRPSALAS
jgi:hypothetical protein